MSSQGHVSRRTLAKGSAWSIPVLAYGAVVPSSSASPAACGALSLTSFCTNLPTLNTNATSVPTFCITPGIAIQPGSTFVGAISGGSPGTAPNQSGSFLNYANVTSLSGTTATFTVSQTIPAGTKVCLTATFTSRFRGRLIVSFSARNINGGANCDGVMASQVQDGNNGGKSRCS